MAPKGAVLFVKLKFVTLKFLVIVVVFAVSLKLVLHVIISYLRHFVVLDGVVFCSIKSVWDPAHFERSSHHLFWSLFPWLLHPMKDQVFRGAFFFPAGVYSKGPVIIQLRYFRRMLSLNGLLRHLSNGCRTGVRPPGMTATSILRRCRSAFTDSVRWARKESQTSSDRSSQGFHGKQVQK